MPKSELRILEACVDSLEKAMDAERNGAHRLELCGRLDLDGLTPSMDLIGIIQNAVSIPVKVMIRPRSGGFVYNDGEFNEMLRSIRRCLELGVTEIATGILLPDNRLDVERIGLIANAAAPMHLTIHKCIDLVPDMAEAIASLKRIPGVTHILSSGQAETAMEGRDMLKKMMSLCAPGLTLIVAGKVTSENLTHHISAIGASDYHGRRIVS